MVETVVFVGAASVAYGVLFLGVIAAAAIAWGAKLALMLALSAIGSAFMCFTAQIKPDSEHLARGFMIGSFGLGVLAALALLV